MRFQKVTVLSVVCSLLLASLAQAGTDTANFQVTATVLDSCMIDSATTLAFGNYDPVAVVENTSTITVICTLGTSYDIGLNEGVTAGATVTTRQMSDGGSSLLDYSLSSDAARTVNWGNTVSSDTVSATGDGSLQNHTVYGRIPLGQYVAPGSYSDTITVTVTY